MNFILKMSGGKIINDGAINSFKSLREGNYECWIVPVRDKTEVEHRSLFFLKVKSIGAHTGDNANIIYDRFKRENNIETTSKISTQEWEDVHRKFDAWIYLSLDIIL